jgi:hypothetical protein
MGIFSKIKKGLKKILKGAKKIVKKVFKGAKKIVKAVKKFAKSKIGKTLLLGAAIYFGGQALGAWGGAPTTTTATAAAETAATATTGATTSAATGAVGSTIPTAATTAGTTTGATLGSELATAAAGATEAPGLLAQAGQWITNNPKLAIAGAKGVAAAMAPDPYEEWKKQQDYMRSSSNIAGVSGAGGGQPIGLGLVDQAQQQDLYAPTQQAQTRKL